MDQKIPFYKYQGTGNDFVMINLFDSPEYINFSKEDIQKICDRKFGIGADGIIFLKSHKDFDFYMEYYNADGSSSDFCGNGGRCIVAFAHQLGIIENETLFLAKDGLHEATVMPSNWVELKMKDVSDVKDVLNGCFLNTGTYHYVEMVEDLKEIDIVGQGRPLRYHAEFQPEGTNVNFVSGDVRQLEILTYERGVEDETLACGTGAIASAMIAVKQANRVGSSIIPLKVKGGDLKVRLHFDGHAFTEVWLCGPAEFVFEGVVKMK